MTAAFAAPPLLQNSPFRMAMGTFWIIGAIGALMPMLPIYFADLGISSSGIALLFAIQAIIALVFAQVAGYWADVHFTRTRLLLWMTLLAALVQAAFPLLPPTIAWFSFGMGLLAISVSQRIAIYNALVFDSRRGEELFGRIRLVGSFSFAVITVLMGWLSDLPMFTIAIIWPALVVHELLIALCLLGLKDHTPAQRGSTQRGRPTFKQVQKLLLSNKLVVRFLVFVFLFQFVAVPLHIMQIKLLRDLGASALFATTTMAVAAIAEMVTFYYGNDLLRRIRLMPLFALCPIAVALRFGLIYFSPTLWTIMLSSLLHMITFGLAYICSVIFINREVPRELKSSGQTLFGLVFSFVSALLGNLACSAFLSLMTNRFGLEDLAALKLLYGVGAIVGLLTLLSWFPMKREYERKHRVSGIFVT